MVAKIVSDGVFNARVRIQQHVVQVAARPLRVEVLADEGRALAIDGVHH